MVGQGSTVCLVVHRCQAMPDAGCVKIKPAYSFRRLETGEVTQQS